jgi:hypothetical protein
LKTGARVRALIKGSRGQGGELVFAFYSGLETFNCAGSRLGLEDNESEVCFLTQVAPPSYQSPCREEVRIDRALEPVPAFYILGPSWVSVA